METTTREPDHLCWMRAEYIGGMRVWTCVGCGRMEGC